MVFSCLRFLPGLEVPSGRSQPSTFPSFPGRMGNLAAKRGGMERDVVTVSLPGTEQVAGQPASPAFKFYTLSRPKLLMPVTRF